jgi:RNA polymerase sigma-70 factor (ECF subfamily)
MRYAPVVLATDFELLDAWRDGDKRAGNALFERHFDGLFRFFRYKLPDRAEDLVQQTLLSCVQAQPGFRKQSSFRTYLYTIARSKLYDALARRARDQAIDFTTSSVVDLGESPSRVLARDQEQNLLVQALRRLPVQLQVILELKYFEHMTGPEIAEVLDVPEGTVRSRLRRARVELQEAVKALCDSPGQVESTMTRLDSWAEALRREEEERQA